MSGRSGRCFGCLGPIRSCTIEPMTLSAFSGGVVSGRVVVAAQGCEIEDSPRCDQDSIRSKGLACDGIQPSSKRTRERERRELCVVAGSVREHLGIIAPAYPAQNSTAIHYAPVAHSRKTQNGRLGNEVGPMIDHRRHSLLPHLRRRPGHLSRSIESICVTKSGLCFGE
jgi:hypothetical protein